MPSTEVSFRFFSCFFVFSCTLLSGRTNAVKLYYKPTGTDKIKYCDICSLYPWVCKYCMFPTGHPSVITENFEQISKDSHPYKGLIKCKVVPPRGLLHPVLPARIRGKLLFMLCNTCAQDTSNTRCRHSDAQRSMWGTWTHIELYKALDMGYKVS